MTDMKSGTELLAEARSLKERLLGYDRPALDAALELRDQVVDLIAGGTYDSNLGAALGMLETALRPYTGVSFAKEVAHTAYYLERTESAVLQAIESAEADESNQEDLMREQIVPSFWALWGLDLCSSTTDDALDAVYEALGDAEDQEMRKTIERVLSGSNDKRILEARQKWRDMPYSYSEFRTRWLAARCESEESEEEEDKEDE